MDLRLSCRPQSGSPSSRRAAVLRLSALAISLVALLAISPQALAAGQERTSAAARAASSSEGEPALALDAEEAIQIAERDANVRAARARRGRLEPVSEAKPPDTWQIGFRDGDEEVVQVLVDDSSATVRESWTGYQVEWQMARGYEGSFGGVLNAPWVWLPLCAVFLLGLLDFRRLRRIVHLDLLVLLGFGLSHYFFNRGEIGLSVPLVYPVLVYLLARMLWVGLRGPGAGLRPSLPTLWLAAGAVFLLTFRLVVNVGDSGVIDVGYAGVIGADLLTHGNAIWGEGAFPQDNPFGDTYGPANYLFYLPFELGIPWSGEWDALPAAHAAAIAFDLATACAMFVLGLRLRDGAAGWKLGATLAFAWAAFPYTAYTLASNANDALVAALLAWSLVLFASPPFRGVLLALAAGTKFAPFVLAPLYLAAGHGLGLRRRGGGTRSRRSRRLGDALSFCVAFGATALALLVLPAIEPGLPTFWERTIGSQIDRSSPFSVWGQAELSALKLAVETFALALAVLVAFIPRRRSFTQICALAAALLIAVQLTADHWFYLYIVWFFPPLIAALAIGAGPADLSRPGKEPARSWLRGRQDRSRPLPPSPTRLPPPSRT